LDLGVHPFPGGFRDAEDDGVETAREIASQSFERALGLPGP